MSGLPDGGECRIEISWANLCWHPFLPRIAFWPQATQPLEDFTCKYENWETNSVTLEEWRLIACWTHSPMPGK